MPNAMGSGGFTKARAPKALRAGLTGHGVKNVHSTILFEACQEAYGRLATINARYISDQLFNRWEY